jgi:hypothetical protein
MGGLAKPSSLVLPPALVEALRVVRFGVLFGMLMGVG